MSSKKCHELENKVGVVSKRQVTDFQDEIKPLGSDHKFKSRLFMRHRICRISIFENVLDFKPCNHTFWCTGDWDRIFVLEFTIKERICYLSLFKSHYYPYHMSDYQVQIQANFIWILWVLIAFLIIALKKMCSAPPELQQYQWLSTAFRNFREGGNYVCK